MNLKFYTARLVLMNLIGSLTLANGVEVALLADATYVDTGNGDEVENIETALQNYGITPTLLEDFDARDIEDWESLFKRHDVLVIPELVKNRLSAHLGSDEATYIKSQLDSGKKLILCGALANADGENFLNEVMGWSIDIISADAVGKRLDDPSGNPSGGWFLGLLSPERIRNHPIDVALQGTGLADDETLPEDVISYRYHYETFISGGTRVFSRDSAIFTNFQITYLGWNFSDPSLDPNDEWSLFLAQTITGLSAPITLDPSFGTNGISSTNEIYHVSSLRQHRAIHPLPDGSILATGFDPDAAFSVWKYRSNGQLDPTFGDNGRARIEVNEFIDEEEAESYRNEASYAITTDANGNIFVTGRVTTGVEDEATTDIFDVGVAKLFSNGQLDSSFGEGGSTILPAVYGQDIYIQNDGKIVVVAQEDYTDRESEAPEGEVVVYRLLTDGSLDSTFGDNGEKVISERGPLTVSSVQLSDGSTVLAGTWENVDTDSLDLYLAKITEDGDMDTSFGQDGLIIYPREFDTYAHDLALLPDGKLVVVGRESRTTQVGRIVLYRYLADGSPDSSFGDEGHVSTSFRNNDVIARSVDIQPDGKIVVAGSAYDGTDVDMLIARYLPSGELDSTFGENGIATISDPTQKLSEAAEDVAVLPNGDILLAGGGFTIDWDFQDGANLLLAQISNNGEATSFSSWIASFDVSETGFDDDPDRDGLSNLTEYAFRLRPDDSNSRCVPPFNLNEDGRLTTLYPNLRSELVYLVEGSDDLQNWDEVGVLVQGDTAPFLDTATVEANPRRFVRFRILAGSTDVETLEIDSISASSSQEGNGPANVIDGDLDTRWSAEGIGEFLTFRLAEQATIREIRAAFYLGDERTASFRLEVSNDGNNFTEVLGTTTSSGNTNALQLFSIPNASAATHIRLIGEGSSANLWNSITEIQLRGN